MRHRPPPKSLRTAWHPLWIRNLRRSFSPVYFRIHAEWTLSQEPLRQDGIVIRKKPLPPDYVPDGLATLLPLLGDITLLNFKGPGAQYDVADYLHTWACAALYCRDEDIADPATLHLMAVAPRVTPGCREQIVRRGRQLLPHSGPGISQVTGADHVLWLVETELVQDPLLRFFSRGFQRDLPKEVPLLQRSERAILTELLADVRRYQQDPRFRLKYPDVESMVMSEEQFYDAVLAMASPEKRVKGLPVEERLKGLLPEERVKGLLPEERIKGLPAEERIKGLPAEERIKGLPAEDLIRALRSTLSEAEWRRLLEPVSPTSKDG